MTAKPTSLIQPVILCGGAGTRLWPLSRADQPKPFLPLLGTRTLFQQALDRVEDKALFTEPLIVAGAGHVPWIEAQAGAHSLIVEPEARNTAPAIALAAASLDPDTVMLVCPSDHHIADTNSFLTSVRQGAALARQDWLVSLGIAPDRPETGYGYIKRGTPLGAGHIIDRFEEKPDLDAARSYCANGGYVWNAGIFVFRAGHLLEELARHQPQMATLVKDAVRDGQVQDKAHFPAPAPFAAIESESIDYAVMENTTRAAVVTAAMGWSDIGNFDALMSARSAGGDAALCPAPHRTIGCKNIMVDSDGPRVSVAGLKDVAVIVRGNEVLVVAREAAQLVSQFAKDD